PPTRWDPGPPCPRGCLTMLGIGRGGPLGAADVARTGGGGGPGSCAGRTEPEAQRPEPEAQRPEPEAQRPEPVSAPSSRLSEREAWIVLASVEGIGPVTFGALLRAFGSGRRAVEAAAGPRGSARLAAALAGEGLTMDPGLADRISPARAEAPALFARLAELHVETLTAEDAGYPYRLRAIELTPPVLFVSGDAAALESSRVVAVVGTRRPTDDGRRTAAAIGGVLAAVGATVVSGLAVGIDGAAHAGALLAQGITVAVLGSGHAHLYPSAHEALAREIVRTGGAVVAELPPDARPRPAGFPRRNRIIAGLADATVVVEAGVRSGALITASWAMEQGRAVFAVPGPLSREQAVGCNRLLREHVGEARLVAGTDELVEDLGYATPLEVRRLRRARSESAQPDVGAIVARLGPAEAAVVHQLLRGPATADLLVGGTDLAGATVLAVLTRLEEEGLVTGTFGRYRLAGPLDGVRAIGATQRPPGGDP
ncbi:MAG: DNA-processing protein DprA, partial [Chloroflexota bacterium]